MKDTNNNKMSPSNRTMIIFACILLISLVCSIASWQVNVRAEEKFRYWQKEAQRENENFIVSSDRIADLEKQITKLEKEISEDNNS